MNDSLFELAKRFQMDGGDGEDEEVLLDSLHEILGRSTAFKDVDSEMLKSSLRRVILASGGGVNVDGFSSSGGGGGIPLIPDEDDADDCRSSKKGGKKKKTKKKKHKKDEGGCYSESILNILNDTDALIRDTDCFLDGVRAERTMMMQNRLDSAPSTMVCDDGGCADEGGDAVIPFPFGPEADRKKKKKRKEKKKGSPALVANDGCDHCPARPEFAEDERGDVAPGNDPKAQAAAAATKALVLKHPPPPPPRPPPRPRSRVDAGGDDGNHLSSSGAAPSLLRPNVDAGDGAGVVELGDWRCDDTQEAGTNDISAELCDVVNRLDGDASSRLNILDDPLWVEGISESNNNSSYADSYWKTDFNDGACYGSSTLLDDQPAWIEGDVPLYNNDYGELVKDPPDGRTERRDKKKKTKKKKERRDCYSSSSSFVHHDSSGSVSRGAFAPDGAGYYHRERSGDGGRLRSSEGNANDDCSRSSDSIFAQADRMHQSQTLDDPSCIEGATDDQYWKSMRGRKSGKNTRRHVMRGNGMAIRKGGSGSMGGRSGVDIDVVFENDHGGSADIDEGEYRDYEDDNGSAWRRRRSRSRSRRRGGGRRSKSRDKRIDRSTYKRRSSSRGSRREKELPAHELRKLHHEQRKQMRLREKKIREEEERSSRKRDCNDPLGAIREGSDDLGRDGYNNNNSRNKQYHQQQQMQRKKSSGLLDRLKRGNAARHQHSAHHRSHSSYAPADASTANSSFHSANSGRSSSLRSSVASSDYDSRASAGGLSARSPRSASCNRSVASGGRGGDLGGFAERSGDDESISIASGNSRSTAKKSVSSRRSAGSRRSNDSGKSNRSGGSRKSAASRLSAGSKRSLASRLSAGSRKSVASRFSWISKKSVGGGGGNGSVKSLKRAMTSNVSVKSMLSRNSRKKAPAAERHEKSTLSGAAAASLVPETVGTATNTSVLQFDDLSSCDSISEDGGGSYASSFCGTVDQLSVAEAVQKLNRQSKIGSRVAASVTGFRRKIQPKRAAV